MATPEHWSVLDGWTMVGRHMKLQAQGLHTVAELLDEMDHYGVAEALVIDCLGRECHPRLGNQRILELTQNQPRLHPIFTALPHAGSDEQDDPHTFVQQLRKSKAAAVALLPNQYRFTLDDWCVDAFLEPLAAAGVPVIVNFNDIGPGGMGTDTTDWKGVVALAQRFPTLPLIVSEYRIRRGQRMMYRALEACPNLRVELSGLWLHRAVEYSTKTFGADRLVYGSNWPLLGPHMTLATLTSSDIDDADKRLIAGDNWRQLMQWCGRTSPAFAPAPPKDAYIAYGRSGKLTPGLRFDDCHGHMGGQFSHYHVPQGTDLDAIVGDMDRLGVQRTCIFSFTGVTSDETIGNDIVAAAVKRHPTRFVGFTLVNPHRGPAMMRAELERGQAMGLRGVKLIPSYQGYPEEGPHIDIACQWAHEHQQCILNHYWGGPAQMQRLVETYPNACFFTGHTTVAYADTMKKHNNLFVCSCPLLPPRACEDVIAVIGADRLLFGSDLLDLPIAWGLGPILFARIKPEEKQLILGGNLCRILEQYSRP